MVTTNPPHFADQIHQRFQFDNNRHISVGERFVFGMGDLQFGQATYDSAILDCIYVVCVHLSCLEIPHRPYIQKKEGIR